MSLLATYGHNPFELEDEFALAIAEHRAWRAAQRARGGGRVVIGAVTAGVSHLKRTRYGMALMSDPCPFCHSPAAALDHVDPRAIGGADDDTNLVGICRSCNSAKGDTPLLAFLSRCGRV